MKFHLAINLERMSPDTSMQDVRNHTLDIVRMADEAGFEVAWAAEHHALEMTIAPNPFQLLTWWANSAYWHPINLAGEAAMLDLVSDGRLEFGIGSGAYQREFDRMRPGVSQKEGYRYAQEMLPVVRGLWQGRPVVQSRSRTLSRYGWRRVRRSRLIMRWRMTATS